MKILFIINTILLYSVVAITLSYYSVPPLLILIIHVAITIILIAINIKNRPNIWSIAKSLLMTCLATYLFIDTSLMLPFIYYLALPYWLMPKATRGNNNWLVHLLRPIIDIHELQREFKLLISMCVFAGSTYLMWPAEHLDVIDALNNPAKEPRYLNIIARNMGGWFSSSEFSNEFDRAIPYDSYEGEMGELNSETIKTTIKELTPSYQGINYTGRMYLERKILIKILKVEFNETYTE